MRELVRASVVVSVVLSVVACQKIYGIEDTKVGDDRCEPLSTRACFEGQSELAGVGECTLGVQTCNTDGTAWEACLGQGMPRVEACLGINDEFDENCDGYKVCNGVYKSVTSNGGLIKKLARDSAGNLYLLGSYSSTFTMGSDTLPAGDFGETFIAKLSPSHEVLWARAIVGLGIQRPLDFTVNMSGGVTVIGAYTTKSGEIFKIGSRTLESSVSTNEASFFIVRYDDAGTITWVSNVQAADLNSKVWIVEDLAGEMFIYLGPNQLHPLLFYRDPSFVATSINSDTNHIPLIIFRISPEGVYRDKIVLSVSQSYVPVAATAMAFDSSHALVIAGNNPNGPLNIFPPDFNAPIPSGPFVARLEVPPEQPLYRMLRTFSLGAIPQAIALDKDDVVFSAGDAFARTVTTAGTTFQIPMSGVVARSVDIDDAKNVVIAGQCFGTVDFNGAGPGGQHNADAEGDVCAAKYGPDGTLIWSKVISSATKQDGVSLRIAPLGDILIGGTAQGPVDFGGGQVNVEGTFLLTLFP